MLPDVESLLQAKKPPPKNKNVLHLMFRNGFLPDSQAPQALNISILMLHHIMSLYKINLREKLKTQMGLTMVQARGFFPQSFASSLKLVKLLIEENVKTPAIVIKGLLKSQTMVKTTLAHCSYSVLRSEDIL